MKYLIIITLLILIPFVSYSQDIIQDVFNIGPPSPSSQSFHKYGNTDISLYTGTPNIVIPIYTIKTKDFTLPISLRYSDANGVRVNEFASWTGLGWTLNTGGLITRTVQDLPDDYVNGYYYMPYPEPTDAWDMHMRLWDGDPDVFNYNYNGNSGSFYIKKYIEGGEILQKPKKNIKIDYILSSTESCKLDAFTIINSKGNKYVFDKKEITAASTFYDDSNIPPNMEIPTSWYLTNILNHNNTDSIFFSYKTISPIRYLEPVPYMDGNNASTMNRLRLMLKIPRIEMITFPGGTIEFISEDDINIRNDKQDTYLKKILVKNNNGSTIKEFTFNYSYFTEDGIVPLLDNNITGVHSNMRLKLNSVTEIGKPPFVFKYNEDEYLPDRYSNAIDHWGYYNGKSNPSLLHNFTVMYKLGPGVTGGDEMIIKSYGNADRSTDQNYVQTMILNEIQYPTGGKTIFEYESNTARIENNIFFPDFISPSEFIVFIDNEPQTMDIISSSAASIHIDGGQLPGEECNMEISFSNIISNITYNAFLTVENGFSSNCLVPNGSYVVSWVYSNTGTNCGTDIPNIIITWENENISPVKDVGGVRIKSVTEITDTERLKRIYTYTDDDGITSGRITSLPYYGHFEEISDRAPFLPVSEFYIDIFSPTPLTYTNGNVVGYRKVTERILNILGYDGMGKAEYTYTTADDYPDLAGATPPWTNYNPNPNLFVNYFNCYWNNIYLKPWPFSQADIHDVQRGLLLKKIDFVNGEQQGYDTLRIIENKYHAFTADGQEKSLPYINPEFVIGHVKDGNYMDEPPYDWCVSNFLSYRINSNYYFKLEEKATNFLDGGKLDIETTYSYDIYDANEENPLYTPTSMSTILSDGSEKQTNFIYPRDVELLSGITADEAIAIDALYERNIILPIQTSIKKEDILIESNRSNYNVFSEGLYPLSIEKAYGNNSLIEELYYEKYDSKGNILQYKKDNDFTTTILWGYNYLHPVAKIENTSFSIAEDVLEILGTSYIDLQTKTSEQLRIIFNDLRTHDNMQAAMVTSYTYDPLIGITSEITPDGIITTYHYDEFNRLETIKDHNANVIKHFEYHYQE